MPGNDPPEWYGRAVIGLLAALLGLAIILLLLGGCAIDGDHRDRISIPAPRTVLLLGIGLVALAWWGRNRDE